MRTTTNGHTLLAGAAAGVVATVTMDAAMVLAARLAPGAFALDKNGPEVIGRWAAGLGCGRWRHEDLSAEPPVRGELWLGLAAHYVTGIVLTEVYLGAAGRCARHPGLSAALAYGVATGVLPLLVMYPSMGYGCCGRRSGDSRCLVGSMLVGHAAFGVGIGLWAATRRRG
jgi:Protein of unknown function (DUF2938)